jgi:hypothetical protein
MPASTSSGRAQGRHQAADSPPSRRERVARIYGIRSPQDNGEIVPDRPSVVGDNSVLCPVTTADNVPSAGRCQRELPVVEV